MAVQVLHEFYQNWEKAYKNVVNVLTVNLGKCPNCSKYDIISFIGGYS